MTNAQVWCSLGLLGAMPVAFLYVTHRIHCEFQKLGDNIDGHLRRVGAEVGDPQR